MVPLIQAELTADGDYCLARAEEVMEEVWQRSFKLIILHLICSILNGLVVKSLFFNSVSEKKLCLTFTKNLEIGVSTKLIVTARIRGNVLRKKKLEEKKILRKKNF